MTAGTITRRLAGFVGTLALAWVVLAWPAFALGGWLGGWCATLAALLCGGVGLLKLAVLLMAREPQARVLAVGGGAALRMFVVLSGGVAFGLVWPTLLDEGLYLWWGWILAFYWISLAAEVAWAYHSQ